MENSKIIFFIAYTEIVIYHPSSMVFDKNPEEISKKGN